MIEEGMLNQENVVFRECLAYSKWDVLFVKLCGQKMNFIECCGKEMGQRKIQYTVNLQGSFRNKIFLEFQVNHNVFCFWKKIRPIM